MWSPLYDAAFHESLRSMLERRTEADFDPMLSLVGFTYLAADFGVEELKEVRLLLTPDEVSEEQFLKAWKGRFEETKGGAAATIRGQLEKRGKLPKAKGDGRADGEYD